MATNGDIPPCLVFHPTMDEFVDFAGYIKKIETENPTMGICKVIPPGTAAAEQRIFCAARLRTHTHSISPFDRSKLSTAPKVDPIRPR